MSPATCGKSLILALALFASRVSAISFDDELNSEDSLMLQEEGRLFFGNISALNVYYNNSIIIIGTLIGLGIAIAIGAAIAVWLRSRSSADSYDNYAQYGYNSKIDGGAKNYYGAARRSGISGEWLYSILKSLTQAQDLYESQ